ncbi:metal-dependent hydrolase [Pseudaquabacterium inlustre]
MTDLPVRRLLVDLETPFARHWNGGDPFRSAFFNALSMSFPFGEQFFIDSVRAGLQTLPEAQRAPFEAEVKGFIGQEATHRRLHSLYNAQLEQQGLKNHWEPRSRRRLARLDGKDVRLHLAVTAAAEHFTAILAEYLLARDEPLAGADPRMALLWRWHASEESEHRSTAFELYRALGGNEEWRLRIFRVVSFNFVCDALRQTVNNLWHDGTWWRPSTWVSGWRVLFGRGGLVPQMYGPWRAYLQADFHPAEHGGQAGLDWLRDNADRFTLVGRAA